MKKRSVFKFIRSPDVAFPPNRSPPPGSTNSLEFSFPQHFPFPPHESDDESSARWSDSFYPSSIGQAFPPASSVANTSSFRESLSLSSYDSEDESEFNQSQDAHVGRDDAVEIWREREKRQSSRMNPRLSNLQKGFHSGKVAAGWLSRLSISGWKPPRPYISEVLDKTFLQSTTTGLEEMRVKRRDAERWMAHRLLPENLRERIRLYVQYRWLETRGVEEENLLRNLLKDLRRDIKRHLGLALVLRVPMFEKMDEQLLDAMCDRLKRVLYTEESYIVREGDPVDEMLFIMRGKLLTIITNGRRTSFFNAEYLKAGDFCGEELLTWALDRHSSSNLLISTRTVRALTEVEAFALKAEDLKFVASQYTQLHGTQLRHTFRFYSQQWRTWAACYIQAAWWKYTKKKLEELLKEEEDRLQNSLAKQEAGGSSPSFWATMYASQYANILRTILRSESVRLTRMPVKPAEPDFNAD